MPVRPIRACIVAAGASLYETTTISVRIGPDVVMIALAQPSHAVVTIRIASSIMMLLKNKFNADCELMDDLLRILKRGLYDLLWRREPDFSGSRPLGSGVISLAQ